MTIWKNIRDILKTEIQIEWNETIQGGVEASKQVLELAKAFKENKNASELAPLIGNISSLLDVLNSPLAQVAGAALPFIPIATGILTFIIEKTEKEPTLAISVGLVGQVAYLESLQQFLRDNPVLKEKLEETSASPEIAKQIKKLGEKLEHNGQEIEFDDRKAKEALICFHDSPLAKVFNSILTKRFEESGLEKQEAETVTERISRSTYRYMKEAVAEVRDNVPPLAAIYGDGWQKDLEAYSSIDKYLKDLIAKKPEETVFDEEFSFRDIYVQLEVKPVNKDGEVDEDANAQDIEDWAKKILLDERKQDQVLFIQAGPGRGKSVFCRMFADWVRQELHPIYTPILIRLRDIKAFEADFDKTLGTAIGWDFITNDNGWLTDRNSRFLFLLDGFDELLLERGVSNDLKLFLEQVSLFQTRAAENSERGHRILITGRPLALYGIERLMPTNLERVGIIPMSEDIQGKWFEKWQKVVDSDSTIAETKTNKFKDFLQNQHCPEQVKTLAQEPLLLYLLAAMHRDNRLKVDMFEDASKGEAKVLIYEEALEWVLEKQRSQKDYNLNLEIGDIEDLRSILAEAGLCVVQSGREYAAISMIESRLMDKEDEGAKELIATAREQSQDEPLKNALAAFYMKSVAGAENSVEFFHKSFGEFLCADRMVESLEKSTTKIGKRRKTYVISTKELEWQIYDLFGYGHLTLEIVDYVIALLAKNEVDVVMLFVRLHDFYLRWSEGEFIEATADTLPQKKARQLQKQGIEQGQRQVDIYTGLNVLILLLELQRYNQSREDLPDKITFYPCGNPDNEEEFDRTRLLKIIGYSECLDPFTFKQKVGKFLSGANLSRADLSGANLSRADLSGANLSGANLSGANLSRAHLSGANLSGADLSGANLSRADLSGANLSGANLSGANLSRADLSGANLSGADLSGANLSRADLSGANLSGANLSGANLSRAHLSGANLSGADLSGANLSRAHLSGANLSGADLSGANLSRADLSGANLSGANLSGANLSRAHLSGANLSEADLSRAHLSRADLSGADLSRANLSGANLSEADLSRAHLSRANLSGANLSRANLSGADLSGADLSGANLSRAHLSEVQWNENTTWANAIDLGEVNGVSKALAQHPAFAATVELS